jgi:arylsulfatase A-like enzyme
MTAVSLLIVLVAVRGMAFAGHHIAMSWWSPIAYLWHDTAIALGFFACAFALRGRPRVEAALYAITAGYAVINLAVQRALGTPLTPTMWRAAGGPLADSARHYATWSTAALIVAASAAATIAFLARQRLPHRSVLGAAALFTALGPFAAARVDTSGLERNAWTALADHLTPHVVASAAPRDWRASEMDDVQDENLAFLRGAAAGRNVILVSLESTAARYLGVYGASPDIAPHLSELSRSAIVFDNAYAVYPESIKGLFSILCSATPAIATAAEEYARVPCESPARVLAARGYRTALFHSGRFAYLGMNAVVRNRGYDTLADAGDIGGERESSFGIDDASTIASILHWIDAGPPDRPFFITYLPIAGHHPYEAPGGGPFPDPDEFGRYRNAVHYGDVALGTLRRSLQARGLDRSTVWIVLGDHGEAFGQHDGNYGHTFQLYEENVHVPFVIAAPGLLTGQTRVRRVVSLLDTAPTLLDVLGVPVPRAYEGGSMLDARRRAALFFTDYSLWLAGMRDGRYKAIHDLWSGRTRVFDLQRDPGEMVDISAQRADASRRYAERLEAWASEERTGHASQRRRAGTE